MPARRSASRRCSRSGSIYVMTHDSIGLGEDGPTHQPIEQLMSLRAMPNLDVYRPADAVETAECWELALRRSGRALGARADPAESAAAPRRRRSTKISARSGAYRLRAAASAAARSCCSPPARRSSWRSHVAEALEAQGIGADVVSMPCWERFDAQDAAYRADILPRRRAARLDRGRRDPRLGALYRPRRPRHRPRPLRRLGARPTTSSSTSASPSKRSCPRFWKG